MKRSESAAKAIVEASIPGSAMSFRPEQSHGQHDFDLMLPGGQMVALEVTEAANPAVNAMIAAIGKGGPFVERREAHTTGGSIQRQGRTSAEYAHTSIDTSRL